MAGVVNEPDVLLTPEGEDEHEVLLVDDQEMRVVAPEVTIAGLAERVTVVVIVEPLFFGAE